MCVLFVILVLRVILVLNGSLGWLNVGLRFGGLVLQIRFCFEVEEKDF